jgi:hypothetical protein
MSQVDRYKPYKGAAAGWGALIADTKNWLGSENALKNIRAMLLHPDIAQRHTHWPFVFTLMLMFLGYIWPNIVLSSISLWAAASSPTSKLFTLPIS